MNKCELRLEVKERLSSMDPATAHGWSARILDRILASEKFAAAKTVCCYVSTPQEADTSGVLAGCWDGGKRVCVPVYRDETADYGLSWVQRGDEMAPARWGIDEPVRQLVAQIDEVDVIVMPGVAFDRRCNRVGHGRGYYDRLLSGCGERAPYKLGLAFSVQLFDEVPHESHDVPLDAVMTEHELLTTE